MRGRAAARDDAAVNFRQFEMRINFRLDCQEVALVREQIEE